MKELHENQKALLDGINETRAQVGAILFLLNKKGVVTDDDIKQEAANRKADKERAEQDTKAESSDSQQEGADTRPDWIVTGKLLSCSIKIV